MNKIIIFSTGNAVHKQLSAVYSSKWDIMTLPHSDLRKTLKTPDAEALYIFDYATSEEDIREKDLNYLLKKKDIFKAVADRKKEIADPAELVLKNCDYISGPLLKDGYKPARLKKYIQFASETSADFTPAKKSEDDKTHRISPEGWKGIKSGKTYSFYMLHVEMSIPSGWKKNSSIEHLNELKQKFQNVVEREASFCNGRVWIWNDCGGLILFPYTGNSCIPVITPLKLLLNRVIISVEDFQYHTPVNIKTAMHLGKTTWKARGKTGTIISDSINSIFHLGAKYTPMNEFDITEDVFLQLNNTLSRLFTDAGVFEDRKIYRLKHIDVLA